MIVSKQSNDEVHGHKEDQEVQQDVLRAWIFFLIYQGTDRISKHYNTLSYGVWTKKIHSRTFRTQAGAIISIETGANHHETTSKANKSPIVREITNDIASNATDKSVPIS